MKKMCKSYMGEGSAAFMLRALVMLVFGLWALVAPHDILRLIVVIVAFALSALGIVEVVRAVHASKKEKAWVLSLIVGILEIGAGLFLFINQGVGIWFIAVVLGVFLVIRGLFDLIVGTVGAGQVSTKVLFFIEGLAGVVLGILLLVFPGLISQTLIWIVGIYAVIVGLVNLVFSLRLMMCKRGVKKGSQRKPVKKSK